MKISIALLMLALTAVIARDEGEYQPLSHSEWLNQPCRMEFYRDSPVYDENCNIIRWEKVPLLIPRYKRNPEVGTEHPALSPQEREQFYRDDELRWIVEHLRKTDQIYVKEVK